MLISPPASVLEHHHDGHHAERALDFAVPDALQARFADAAQRARADVGAFLAQHPNASARNFAMFVIGRIGAPATPSTDAEDVALTKAAIATRDDKHNAEAVWIDGDGINDAWKGALERLDADTGRRQAASGVALLDQARSFALSMSAVAKESYRRLRPFQAHPDEIKLSPGIEHVNGFSYPSGHATHAFVTAGVLAALDPQQAASAFATAQQVAYARVYAAAHFSSDVAMGAYLGSAVAAFLTARR